MMVWSFRIVMAAVMISLLQAGGPQQSPTILVSGDASGAPSNCQASDVVDRVKAFIAAFNRGDADEVKRSFVSNFAWFSVTTDDVPTSGSVSQNFVAYNSKALTDYVVSRHAYHESLQLQSLELNGWDAARGLIHFSVTLTRQADDLLPAGEVHPSTGKGAYRCADQRLFVWSMGTQMERQPPD